MLSMFAPAVRPVLVKAHKEWVADGLLSTDTQIELRNNNVDPEEIVDLFKEDEAL